MNLLINFALAAFSIYMIILSVEKITEIKNTRATKRSVMNLFDNIFDKKEDK